MDRTAVFVDAGYLFASGSKLISNEKLPRSELLFDEDVALALFESLATELSGLPMLRIYWYDGASAGPSPGQIALGFKPSVKLRLGFLNQQGQQLGVDSLIVSDLINLARNHAMTDALLLTGDEDIRIGVQQAQECGVRVHLLGIAPTGENQSSLLVQEADSVYELGRAQVQAFLSRVTGAANLPTTVAVKTRLQELAGTLARQLGAEAMAAALKGSVGGSVSPQIDRQLLLAGTRATGGVPLSTEDKRSMRAAFLAACRET